MKKGILMCLLSFALAAGVSSLTHAQMGEPGSPLDLPSSHVTIDGTLLKIEGEFYVVQDATGREVRLHVNDNTMLLGGKKRAGDAIRAEVTADGHAIAIQ